MARKFGGGQRMAKAWLTTSAGTKDLVGAADEAILQILNFTGPGTILRMLGEYVIVPTAAPVAGDEALVTVGIGMVSTDAAALGETAMPDPASDADYDWLYWSSHRLVFGTTSVDPSSLGASVRKLFDVRSMRKFKPSSSLVMVVQLESGIGDPPVTISVGYTRVLIAT